MICPHCGKPIESKLTARTIRQIRKLRAEGYSCRDVAEMVGCSFATVSRVSRDVVPGGKP